MQVTDYIYTGQHDNEGIGGLMEYCEASRSEAERTRRDFMTLILTTSFSRIR
jgi:hypothetical protein